MKILGYTYAVVEVESADMLGAFGKQHARTQNLYIAADMHEEGMVSTLLHEVLEALNFHLEIGLSHSKIAQLEAGLYQVFSDNGVDLRPLTKNPAQKERSSRRRNGRKQQQEDGSQNY